MAVYPAQRLSSVHTAAIFGDGYVMKRMATPSSSVVTVVVGSA